MSTNRYTTNPLTGRTIRVGGPTFNQLVMDAYDYLDNGLVRRDTAPPLPRERSSYLNIETGRIVQYGTRTYFYLVQNAGYDIVEDYYLVPPRYAQIAWYSQDILHWQDTQIRLEMLNNILNQQIAEEARQFIGHRPRGADNSQRDVQLRRLTELNIALCKECQMPVNLNELPESGLCTDCHE
jgi:hypothetical protein